MFHPFFVGGSSLILSFHNHHPFFWWVKNHQCVRICSSDFCGNRIRILNFPWSRWRGDQRSHPQQQPCHWGGLVMYQAIFCFWDLKDNLMGDLMGVEKKWKTGDMIWLVVWLPFLIFPYIGNNHPNWLSYFSEGFKPPTSDIIWYFMIW